MFVILNLKLNLLFVLFAMQPYTLLEDTGDP